MDFQPVNGVSADARAQTLETAADRCADAERAAQQGCWGDARGDVDAVQRLLQHVLGDVGPGGLRGDETRLLKDIHERIRVLRTRALAAREATAQALSARRKQRHAAAAYQRHGR